jgi:hypothetical protein
VIVHFPTHEPLSPAVYLLWVRLAMHCATKYFITGAALLRHKLSDHLQMVIS